MAASRSSISVVKHQQGLVLLVLVIVIILAFTTYGLSGLSLSSIKNNRDKQTLMHLKKAKQAVIDYAVTYSDRGLNNGYGLLPNPDTVLSEGVMSGNIGTQNTNVIGWLPWRSLDIANLKDDSGTCLFYAVSGSYKLGSTAQAEMVNEDSVGMFRILNNADIVVQGGSEASQVVALVIAPDKALAGQARTPAELLSSCGRDYSSVSHYDVSAYLEGNGIYDNGQLSGTADTVDDFIHATASSMDAATPYNDKFLTINRDEIWKAIVKRSDFKNDMESLTQGLATCVANYANSIANTSRRLPWPTKIDLGATLNYRSNGSYVDDNATQGYSGRYPFNISNTNNTHENIDPVLIDFPEDDLFEISGLCDNLGNDWEGNVINLEADSSKYRQLWNNWKDHFFYMISKVYEPDDSGIEKTCADAATTCIKVNTIEYAGAIIFSGSRFDGVSRANKALLIDYLEDDKSTAFSTEQINKTGDGDYNYTDPQTTTINDMMYCIQDQPLGTPLDVIECI